MQTKQTLRKAAAQVLKMALKARRTSQDFDSDTTYLYNLGRYHGLKTAINFL